MLQAVAERVECVSAAPPRRLMAGIAARLRLTRRDTLLHLGCGDGTVSEPLFPHVGAFLGVDRSPHAVSVAQRAFGRPGFGFAVSECAGFAATRPATWRFTAALCHDSFPTLGDTDATVMLSALFLRFPRLGRVLLAGLPCCQVEQSRHAATSRPLVWRSPEAVQRLAERCGWQASTFQDAADRFDTVLERPGTTVACSEG